MSTGRASRMISGAARMTVGLATSYRARPWWAIRKRLSAASRAGSVRSGRPASDRWWRATATAAAPGTASTATRPRATSAVARRGHAVAAATAAQPGERAEGEDGRPRRRTPEQHGPDGADPGRTEERDGVAAPPGLRVGHEAGEAHPGDRRDRRGDGLEVARLQALHVAQQADADDEPRPEEDRAGEREPLDPPARAAPGERDQRRARPQDERRQQQRADGRRVAVTGRAEEPQRPRRVERERGRGRRAREAVEPVEHEDDVPDAPVRRADRPRPRAERGQRGGGDPAQAHGDERREAAGQREDLPARRQVERDQREQRQRRQDDQGLEQLDVEGDAEHGSGGDHGPHPARLRADDDQPRRQHVEEHHQRVHRVAVGGEDRRRQDGERGRRGQPGAAPEEAAHEVVQQRDREDPGRDLGHPQRPPTRSRAA